MNTKTIEKPKTKVNNKLTELKVLGEKQPLALKDEAFKIARTQVVAKRNDMIQKSRFALTSTEQKAVTYLLSKIKPDDKPGTMYYFDCEEFYRLTNRSGNSSSNSYTFIKDKLKRISDASWWIDASDEQHPDREKLVRWFDIVELDKQRSTIGITLHREMIPFVLDLFNQQQEKGIYYTSYTVQSIAIMKSKYGPRLYELLKSYANNHEWIFEIATGNRSRDLHWLLAGIKEVKGKRVISIPKSWSNFSQFCRDVLTPACSEINLFTDLNVSYEGIKYDLSGQKSRSICAIKFRIENKNQLQKTKADYQIDREYETTEEEVLIPQVCATKEIETDLNIIDGEYVEVCKYPELFEILKKDLTQKQTEYIFDATEKFRIKMRINPEMDEAWVCDYVSIIYKHILRTSDLTKTSVYNRLLNEVEQDYKNIHMTITDEVYVLPDGMTRGQYFLAATQETGNIGKDIKEQKTQTELELEKEREKLNSLSKEELIEYLVRLKS